MAESCFKSKMNPDEENSTGLYLQGFHFRISTKDDSKESLKEKLNAAYRSIQFLQKEHTTMIQGLHNEIERLQNYIRDMQFQHEVLGILVPNNDFFNCDIATLQEKVDLLISDNNDMTRRLSDSNRALESLDQKQQLERWQHKQELDEKELTILRLQQELETKCSSLAEMSLQLNRKKKNSFLRRFGFNSSNAPANSSLNCSNSGASFDQKNQSTSNYELPSQNVGCDYSSFSSLSDKSTSEDELKVPYMRKQHSFPISEYSCRQQSQQEDLLKLPPLPGLTLKRQLVRQQLRLDKFPVTQNSFPEMIKKRSLV